MFDALGMTWTDGGNFADFVSDHRSLLVQLRGVLKLLNRLCGQVSYRHEPIEHTLSRLVKFDWAALSHTKSVTTQV